MLARLAAAGRILKRGLVWREDGCYRRSSYDPFRGGFGAVSECQPTQGMSDPIVRQALGERRHQAPSQIPQMVDPAAAHVIRERCRARVFIGDARYGEAPLAPRP